MSAADDARELELLRLGTRFVSEETEQQFRAWQFERSLPQLRVQHVMTTAVWAGMPIIGAFFIDISTVEVGAIVLLLIACAAVGAEALRRRSVRLWRFYLLVPASIAFVAILWALERCQGFDHGALALVIGLGASLPFAVSSEGAGVVAPSALIAVLGAIGLRAQLWLAGEVSLLALVIEALVMLLTFCFGALAAVSNDRAAHTGYRQQRIIEAQKATIAQAEAMLQRELSHQVAERSREIGAAFARADATLDVRRLSPGERFAERYRIVSAMGAGAMGAVYEVERVTDGEKLALKAVVGEVSTSSAARFAREAEIGARIRHANVIPIVDVGVASGVPFLVMELVEGGSLEGQRDRFGDVGWALPILEQITEGLAALHDAGVVHRDLKPANVLLAREGAKISDFGISRLGEIDEASSIDASGATLAASPRPRSGLVTGTGVILGTPLYMAPEAARGGRALDAAADVFALGILAYEMLTGRAPYAVPPFVLALAEQSLPPPAPLDDARIPTKVRALVLECMAAEPTKRPRVRNVLNALA